MRGKGGEMGREKEMEGGKREGGMERGGTEGTLGEEKSPEVRKK